jgi:hypothetical protein
LRHRGIFPDLSIASHRKGDVKRIVALAALVLASSASASLTGGTPVALVSRTS